MCDGEFTFWMENGKQHRRICSHSTLSGLQFQLTWYHVLMWYTSNFKSRFGQVIQG